MRPGKVITNICKGTVHNMVIGINVGAVRQIIIALDVKEKRGGFVVTERDKKSPQADHHKYHETNHYVKSLKVFFLGFAHAYSSR